jgi:hypothetical protein
MRVGISMGTTFDPADSARAPRSVLAQADAAVRAGLDSLTVGDRHSLAQNAYLQNAPLIGRILGVRDQRPAGCLFLDGEVLAGLAQPGARNLPSRDTGRAGSPTSTASSARSPRTRSA